MLLSRIYSAEQLDDNTLQYTTTSPMMGDFEGVECQRRRWYHALNIACYVVYALWCFQCVCVFFCRCFVVLCGCLSELSAAPCLFSIYLSMLWWDERITGRVIVYVQHEQQRQQMGTTQSQSIYKIFGLVECEGGKNTVERDRRANRTDRPTRNRCSCGGVTANAATSQRWLVRYTKHYTTATPTTTTRCWWNAARVGVNIWQTTKRNIQLHTHTLHCNTHKLSTLKTVCAVYLFCEFFSVLESLLFGVWRWPLRFKTRFEYDKHCPRLTN